MKHVVLAATLSAILAGCASTAGVPPALTEYYRQFDCDDLDSLQRGQHDDTRERAIQQARLSKSCDAPRSIQGT